MVVLFYAAGLDYPSSCPVSFSITDLINCFISVYMCLSFFSPSVSRVLCVVSTSCLCCVMRDCTLGALVSELNQVEGRGRLGSIFSVSTLRKIFLDYG